MVENRTHDALGAFYIPNEAMMEITFDPLLSSGIQKKIPKDTERDKRNY